MMTELVCFQCQNKLTFTGLIGRRDECPKCRADVHVCKNCSNWDPKAYNECKEPTAERIQDKDRANYCDQFAARTGGQSSQDDKRAALRAAAEALFKKKD